MATSGSTALVVTRDEIIQEALEQLQVVEPGATPEAVWTTSAAFTLNAMVKAWQTSGLQIQTVSRRYLFAEPEQREYTLTATGDRWVSAYLATEVKVDAVAAAFTVDVNSIEGVTDGDAIGIYLDDTTMHWTTVNGAPAGDTITFTDALPDDASEGNTVYTYHQADRADRPMELINIWERNFQGNDRPLDLISRTEYAELTLKENTGGIVSVFYDPQVTPPKAFIWPIHEDLRMILGTWVKRTIETFDTATDDADFPQEAFLALAFNLAFWLIPKATPSAQTAQFITQQAGVSYENYQDYAGRPEANVEFQPFGEGDWGNYDGDEGGGTF